jgi:hypothetical protein
MISDLGYGTYFFFGTIVVCMGIWAFFCVPETKGMPPIFFLHGLPLQPSAIH